MAKAERHLPLCSNTARLAAYLAFLVHEIEKRRGSLRITQSTMVVFKVDTVSFAEISKTAKLVARITSSHSRASAELRKTKAALKTLILVGDEAVIEISRYARQISRRP